MVIIEFVMIHKNTNKRVSVTADSCEYFGENLVVFFGVHCQPYPICIIYNIIQLKNEK